MSPFTFVCAAFAACRACSEFVGFFKTPNMTVPQGHGLASGQALPHNSGNGNEPR